MGEPNGIAAGTTPASVEEDPSTLVATLDEPTIVDRPPCPPSKHIVASYADCERIARKTAKNFYYAFLVLPKQERLSMCALYSFMRKTDDLGDNDLPIEERRRHLAQWREKLNQTLAGEHPPISWQHALADTCRRYSIPPALLHATIDGVESDLDRSRYETFDELYRYCYHVASVVGMASIRIWGVTNPEADRPAEWCGIAFQLTNILRDVVEDYQNGRIYLPLEDLRRFGVAEEELAGPLPSPAFEELMRFEIARAHEHYDRGMALLHELPAPGRAVFQVMVDLYRGLLRKIERRPAAVLKGRVALSYSHKMAMVLKALPTRFLARDAARTADSIGVS